MTLPSGAGLVNVGYAFAGWNTKADGTGTSYLPGATYVFSTSETLYAQWTPNVYVVSFAAGSGVTAPPAVNYTYGTTPIVLPTPVLVGNQFSGWFSASTGGTLIGAGASQYTPVGSVTLYAQWTPNVYVVSFAAGSGVTAPPAVNYTYGTTPIVLPTPVLVGNQFSGWFSSSSGGALIGAGASQYTPVGSVTLYAQWAELVKVTLSFDANGGSGSISSILGLPGSAITLPGQTGLLRSGYSLTHWNSAAKGTGTSYVPGQSLTITANSVLYAQWTGRAPVTLYGAIGTFARNSSHLSASLKVQVNRLSLMIKAKKYSSVSLFGYTATTGLASINMSLSRSRATNVANYLRTRIAVLKLHGVLVKASGQGAVSGGNTPAYSRVEVFVR